MFSAKWFKKFFNYVSVNNSQNNMSVSSNSIVMNSNNVKLNGKTYNIPSCSSISIVNGTLYVDGKVFDEEEKREVVHITVVVNGDAGNIEFFNGSATVHGSSKQIKTTNGDVNIGGDVVGDVKTTNGNVSSKTISGKVSTVNGNVNKSFLKEDK